MRKKRDTTEMTCQGTSRQTTQILYLLYDSHIIIYFYKSYCVFEYFHQRGAHSGAVLVRFEYLKLLHTK